MYDMYPWNEPDSGANRDQEQTAAARLPAPRDGSAPRHADDTRQAEGARRANGARPANGARRANGARHSTDSDVPAEFTQAVQFALDRRDNGGAAAPPAPRPATPPAPSLTRQ